jgi:hypothetical protein
MPMEFRWLTKEEQRTRGIESSSLPEVLTLAQKLQAEGEGLVSEAQVVEMGRELGIRPEHVREALCLRRAAQLPPAHRAVAERPALTHDPVATVMRAALLGLGLGTLPLAVAALAQTDSEAVALFVLVATFTAGWSARYPRWAGVAGALAVPAVLFAALIGWPHGLGIGMEGVAFFLSLLSFTPLGSAVGCGAASLRRRVERLSDRARLTAPGHLP